MTFINKLSNALVSRSIKYAIRESGNRFKELLRLACFWRYQLSEFSFNKFSHTKFIILD